MKTELRHSEIEELLGVYALDAVDDDERVVVDQHLSSCARCRAEVEEHREVAALLAHTGAPAPEGLWDRIAQSLEGESFDGTASPPAPFLPSIVPSGELTGRAEAQPTDRSAWRTRVAGAVLAAAAAVIVVLGVQMSAQDQRLDEVTALLELDALQRAYQAAESMPDSEVIEIKSFDGLRDSKAVITDEGEGYFDASSLPPLPEGRVYQLWADVGDRRVSLGPLGADPDVVPFAVLPQFVGLGITEETEPGVIVSEQPILAYGLLPG